MNWFRVYNEIVNDPKLLLLDDQSYRFWMNCLGLTNIHNGILPKEAHVAAALHMPIATARKRIAKLTDAGLLERHGDNLVPHNWKGRQYLSDSSAARTRRYRDRHRDAEETVTPTVTVTPLTEQSRTEAEQSRADAITPQAAFDDLWREFAELYPAHRFDADFANQMWQSRTSTIEDAAAIVAGLHAALKSSDWTDKDGKFVPFASKFIGEQKYKLAYKPGPPKIDWENI